MNARVSQMFRSVQVYFPFLQDLQVSFAEKGKVGYSIKLMRRISKHFPIYRKSSNKLFLDIGANRGEAIQSILLKRPDANVIAFEPYDHVTQQLSPATT